MTTTPFPRPELVLAQLEEPGIEACRGLTALRTSTATSALTQHWLVIVRRPLQSVVDLVAFEALHVSPTFCLKKAYEAGGQVEATIASVADLLAATHGRSVLRLDLVIELSGARKLLTGAWSPKRAPISRAFADVVFQAGIAAANGRTVRVLEPGAERDAFVALLALSEGPQ